MSRLVKFLLPLVYISLADVHASWAADKTQAWGARMTASHSATMRNRNKSARVWVGEQVRGWGQGSRITNGLTTSMAFHLESSQKALETIKSNTDVANRMSVSACGTCVSLENNGNDYAISGNAVNSVNSGSVTSLAEFTN